MPTDSDTLSQLRGGHLRGIQRLDLSCGLEEFPREIFDLADSLEILNLSGNRLRDLPPDLPRLRRLRVIFLSQNEFRHLPPVLGECPGLSMIGFKSNQISEVDGRALPPALRWLILTDNQIRRLPEEIGNCTALQKLMLAGNRLESLPESLAACQNLELLRLAANGLETLPSWLLCLPRLAWLAIGGNPCTAEQAVSGPEGAADFNAAGAPDNSAIPEIPEIPWARLRSGAKIGEGASGVIHRAEWLTGAPGDGAAETLAEPVALKIFKGAVTSDGLPSCEISACLAVGRHANLIGVQGRVTGHPEGADALVMPLISPEFRNLAGPPSLESCTRDIYPDNFRISLSAALRLAESIASAAAHLHARGILHGDLYAHNVLWRENGDCLLGDFGAASRYPLRDQATAGALERIEVRAFGCLLEELCQAQGGGGTAADEELVRHALRSLTQQCLQPEVHERPSFAQLARHLGQLRADAGSGTGLPERRA